MAYLDNLLADGETIQIKAHRHILFLVGRTLLSALATIALWAMAGVVWAQWDTSSGAKTIIALGLLVASLVPLARAIQRLLIWRTEEYVVTNYRILQVEGLLNKRTFDSALNKVNDVMMTQSIFGRLFDYGNIDIITGSDMGVNKLSGLSQPATFKKVLMKSKTELEYGDRSVSEAPSLARSDPEDRRSADLVAALNELTNLRESGVITAEEYEARARQILRP